MHVQYTDGDTKPSQIQYMLFDEYNNYIEYQAFIESEDLIYFVGRYSYSNKFAGFLYRYEGSNSVDCNEIGPTITTYLDSDLIINDGVVMVK